MTKARSPETQLRHYLQAGLHEDHSVLLNCYAPDFENIRVGLDGSVTRIDRQAMVDNLTALWNSGRRLQPADDVAVLSTARFDQFGSVLFERIKEGRRFVYTFVFDMSAPTITLAWEIAVETRRDET
jgi:hypothetical protein